MKFIKVRCVKYACYRNECMYDTTLVCPLGLGTYIRLINKKLNIALKMVRYCTEN